jgi:hypothetical protein
MTDTKLASNGNIRLWFGSTSSMANPLAPTAIEINAMLDISDAVSWNDFDFGVQASNTIDDPAITAKSSVQDRGASNYGGNLSFYYPGTFNDNTNKFSLVFDALRIPGTQGFIVMRVDGKEATTTIGTTSFPGTVSNGGDLVHTFKVESGGWDDSIEGEDAQRYTISFLPKGQIAVYTVVRPTATAPTVAILPLTGAATVAGSTKVKLQATVNTRNQTRGGKWISSDITRATVSANGIVTPVAAGTASISFVWPETNTTSAAPSVITVT